MKYKVSESAILAFPTAPVGDGNEYKLRIWFSLVTNFMGKHDISQCCICHPSSRAEVLEKLLPCFPKPSLCLQDSSRMCEVAEVGAMTWVIDTAWDRWATRQSLSVLREVQCGRSKTCTMTVEGPSALLPMLEIARVECPGRNKDLVGA